MQKKLILSLALTMALPLAYASVFGPLANFDVVNDTGETAHGFEIEIEDIVEADITSIFGAASRWPNMERYGPPTVALFNDGIRRGVRITYKGVFNGASWSIGTPYGTLPVSPSDSCWPYGAPTYGPNYPCDHFGVSTRINTPKVKYSWLVETAGNIGVLRPVTASVPNPVWTVTPVPPVANVPQPPVVNVLIVAPAPQQYEFGEPQWVKVTATGTLRDIAVEELVAENALIQQARTQVQLEWQLLQVDSGSPGSGQIDLTGVALDIGAMGVVYRFEFYKYTGARDPLTNEAKAINGDTTKPAPSDLGAFIVAQNAGINFDGAVPAAPPLPAGPVLSVTIAGATVGFPYNNIINATPGVPGDVLQITVVGLPLGLFFDSLTNSIKGTPAAVGTFPLTIRALDVTNGLSTTGNTNLSVSSPAIVFTLSLPGGTVGTPYSKKLIASGGYGAITYSIPANNLPVGISFTSDTIIGTPTVAGSTSITAVAKDSLGYTQVSTATLVISGVIVPPPPPPPVACSGTNKVISSKTAISFDIAGGLANGGQSVTNAPAAQTTFVAPLTPAGGILAGMLATYTGTIAPNSFCAATSMTIAPGLSINSITLPAARVGVAYTATTISATGGVPPYTITVSGLSSGMAFSGTAITGTPVLGTDGVKVLAVSAKDSNGATALATANLTINPPLAIVLGAVNLPAGVVGAGYSGSASASGGTGSLSWSATGLPIGLVISAAGVVSGLPTAAAVYNVTLTVKDSLNITSSVTRSVTISAAALSCISPTGAMTGLEGKGTITSVSGTRVTIKTSQNTLVNVIVPGCAKIELNGGAKGFAVGQIFEWHGYSALATGMVATEVTIN